MGQFSISLKWECLDKDTAYRASAPLFGAIRVERYSTSEEWQLNWSCPGYSDALTREKFENAAAAKRMAEELLAKAIDASLRSQTEIRLEAYSAVIAIAARQFDDRETRHIAQQIRALSPQTVLDFQAARDDELEALRARVAELE